MNSIKVWDPLVRIFHWTLVGAFAANALIISKHSDWHLYLGYVIVGLIIFRVVWGIVGTQYARFNSFPPSLSGSIAQIREMGGKVGKPHIGHTPLGALMIYNLIFSLAMIGLSGYLMTTDMFWGVEWPEELHELFVNWAEISVVAHIAAVIYESKRTAVNLPKAMVTGRKDFRN